MSSLWKKAKNDINYYLLPDNTHPKVILKRVFANRMAFVIGSSSYELDNTNLILKYLNLVFDKNHLHYILIFNKSVCN